MRNKRHIKRVLRQHARRKTHPKQGGTQMEITVKAGTRTYPVIVERGLTDRLAEVLAPYAAGRKVAVVTDDNVAKLWLPRLLAALPEGTPVYTLPHGENSKNGETAGKIVEWLAANKLTRTDIVAAFGGGVVGDITGFAASVYMRGIDYVQIPTTLLAGIDSSVGGKTAVDLSAGKNLAGRIYPPAAVLFDPDILSTLPPAEWKCGIGEAVKYAVLAGGEIFDIMEDDLKKGDNLERLVALCVDYKRRVVEADENEAGERRLLNLGHTIGHAIEAESGLGFPHGVCVAMGIAVIARACIRGGLLGKDDYLRIMSLLQKYGFPECPYSVRAMLPRLAHDKKLTDGTLKAVVIRSVGNCEIKEMSLDEAEKFLV